MKEKEKQYSEFLQKTVNFEKMREEKTKEISKDSLFKSCKKSIQTTMIGSLDAVEKSMGFLWRHNQHGEELSDEEKYLKECYEKLRDKILDNGNTQIRILEAEFASYDVNSKSLHHTHLTIKNNQEGE
jgi:transcription termination factor Rho